MPDLKSAAGEGVEEVVRTATKTVQRIVRAAANNTDSVRKSGSKILQALANNTHINETGKGIGAAVQHGFQQAVNATKLYVDILICCAFFKAL